jgi:hypothetical protein
MLVELLFKNITWAAVLPMKPFPAITQNCMGQIIHSSNLLNTPRLSLLVIN